MVVPKFNEFIKSGCIVWISSVKQRWSATNFKIRDDLVCSSDNNFQVVSRVAVIEDLNLSSYKEEADTKIILHCASVVHRNYGENVCIWSSSCNTDLVVLAVGLLQELNDWVFIANGCGSNKEHCKLSDFDIDIDSISAFLGLHAFTVNDYVSLFFRKEKEKC